MVYKITKKYKFSIDIFKVHLYNEYCAVREQMQLNIFKNSEKYSRGRRGAPAKGVGRATGARVQIPLSPLEHFQKTLKKLFKNKLKKVLDKV